MTIIPFYVTSSASTDNHLSAAIKDQNRVKSKGEGNPLVSSRL